MKKMSKKLVISLAALSATALVGGFGVATDASANTGVTAESVSFSMATGASVRLKNDGHNGLRYAIEMDETQYESLMDMVGEEKTYTEMTFGVLIAPAAYESTYGEFNAANVFGIGGTAVYDWAVQNGSGNWEYTQAGKTRIANFETAGLTPSTAVGKEDVVTYYGALTDILSANLTREFIGVGYMRYVEEGQTKVRFATENDNVRSIAYVASKAANSGEDYSAYNEVLKGYVAGAFETGAIDLEIKGATEVTALEAGENKQTLNLNTTSELDVQWTSSDDTVATLVDGELTWVNEGAVTVTAKIGDLYESEKTLYSYVPEADNVTYFNKASGIKSVVCGLQPDLNPIAVTNERAYAGEGTSLKFTTTKGTGNYYGYGQLNLTSPYIKDLSGYVATLTADAWDDFVAIDFYVYAEVDENASFTPCINYGRSSQATDMLGLKKNAWTSVRFYSYDGTSWGLIVQDAGTSAYSVTMNPADISDWFIRFYYGIGESLENPTASYYISTLRIGNSSVISSAGVEVAKTVLVGNSVALPAATVNGSTEGVTYEVYADNALVTESSVSFATAGVHTITYAVYKNGEFVTYLSKSVTVVAVEEGNIAYFNHAFGADGVSSDSSNSFESTNNPPAYAADMPQDEYVLKFNFTTNTWGYDGIKFTNPYITNLMDYHTGSGWVAMDFYVYAAVDASSSYTPTLSMDCGGAQTSAITLTPNAWTKIRYFSNDGNTWFLLGGAYGYETTNGRNIKDLTIKIGYGNWGVYGPYPASTYYITTPRVVTGV